MTAPFSGDENGESFWVWLRDRVFSPPRIPARRLEALNQAIRGDPDGASNYVLRGELLLQTGHYAEAAEDFERALALAGQQYEKDNWGLLSQVLRDQAEIGLEQAQRKLKRNKS